MWGDTDGEEEGQVGYDQREVMVLGGKDVGERGHGGKTRGRG